MISEEERKAIGQCKLLLAGDITLHILDDDGGTAYAGIVNKEYNKDLETVLNLIETQNKMIELMAEHIDDLSEKLKLENEDISYAPCNDMETMNYCLEYECKDCIKQYFEKKVDEQICKD